MTLDPLKNCLHEMPSSSILRRRPWWVAARMGLAMSNQPRRRSSSRRMIKRTSRRCSRDLARRLFARAPKKKTNEKVHHIFVVKEIRLKANEGSLPPGLSPARNH
jgi:hypothetical protein